MLKLSPTSLHLWESNREDFYVKYLSGLERQDEKQSLAMAVGSSFDAYVKSALCKHIFGSCPPGYSLDELLREQVDAEILDDAMAAGKHVFSRYVDCGAYNELLDWICRSDETPRFEFKLTGEIEGISLMGKPDCWFTHKGIHVVLDWKVNGYCSNSATSPKKLYSHCRDTWGEDEGKPTRGGAGPHKMYVPMDYHGLQIGSHYLDDTDAGWADQLCIYSWMLGVPVGAEEVVTCIDQIAAKPGDLSPLLRVAQHRCRISKFWQHSLLGRLQDCWRTIQSGHIFTDMSREESEARCEALKMQLRDSDPFWSSLSSKGYK
jgi:hypothetical protein